MLEAVMGGYINSLKLQKCHWLFTV